MATSEENNLQVRYIAMPIPMDWPIAKLTVTKVVVNTGGGTKMVADFPLFVDGRSVISGVQNIFNLGVHVVSETEDADYTAVFSGDCDSEGNITLTAGDEKNVTVTNTYAPPSGEITIEVACVDGFDFTDPGVTDLPIKFYGTINNPGPIDLTGVIISDDMITAHSGDLYWIPVIWDPDAFPEGPPDKSAMADIDLAIGASAYFYGEYSPPGGTYYTNTSTVTSTEGATAEGNSECLMGHD